MKMSDKGFEMSKKGFDMSEKESPLDAHNQDKNQTKKRHVVSVNTQFRPNY